MSWGLPNATVAPDVQERVIDLLTDLSLDLDGEAVTVGPSYPEEATPEADNLPYLGVLDDGSPTFSAVAETTLIQVTAWADNPSPAKRLAAVARGALLDFRGSDSLGSILPGTRMAPAKDPETGYWLAAFTVRVISRPA